jgi:glycosyltransferase involved in cell wall biosynthesis
MKVLQVINNIDIGGAETLLKNYVLNNEDSEIENDICLLLDSSTFILDQLVRKNIKVFQLKLKKYSMFKAVRELRKIIAQGGYDCVHVHLFPGQYYCAKLAGEFKNVRFIFTEHSTFNKRREIRALYGIEKWSYSKYDRIICVSEMTRKSLESWMPALKPKLTVIHGGIVVKAAARQEEPYYDAILVGSLRGREKGVDLFIKALKKIESSISRAVILGDGVLKDEFVALRDSLDLTDKIEFAGNVENVNEYLAKSRLFVLPSRWEGFGLAIIEAMAARLPVVASNIGGIPEIITDGKDGILVPVEDVDALSRSMLGILEDKEKAAALGENAYNTVVERFSMQVFSKKMNTLYREVVQGK